MALHILWATMGLYWDSSQLTNFHLTQLHLTNSHLVNSHQTTVPFVHSPNWPTSIWSLPIWHILKLPFALLWMPNPFYAFVPTQKLCNTVVNLIMEAEFITTTRGGTALVYQGYKYYKIRSGVDGKTFWRCAHRKRCPARATTLDNNVQSMNENHDHPPDHIQIKVDKLTVTVCI